MRLPALLFSASLALVLATLAAGTTDTKHGQQRDEVGPPKSPQRRAADGKRPRHIRVVTLETPPFMMKRQPAERADAAPGGQFSSTKAKQAAPEASQLWYGYCMDFFLELIKHLPYELTYEIREVPDRKFGSKRSEMLEDQSDQSAANSSGARAKPKFKRVESWNGLVGELQQQRAELALAPMAVMAERELEVDFTVPFYDLVGIQILLKRPEVPQNWFKFLTVLDNDVWLSIGLAYFVTSFIIYIFDRLSPYSHKNETRIERTRERAARKLKRAQMDLDARPSSRAQQLRAGLARVQLERALTGGPVAPMVQQRGSVAQHQLSAKLDGFRSVATLWGAAPGALVPLSGSPLTNADELSRVSGGSLIASRSLGAQASRRRSQDYLTGMRARFAKMTRSRETRRQHAEDHNAHHTTAAYDQRGQHDSDSDTDHNDGKPDFNFRDSLWFCITSLTPQGGGEAPQNLSGRVVAGAWWLFCFIVIASYTANLAAFLTVSRLDIPIESLDELAKQYRIKYAPIHGTAEQTYFERMAYIEEIFYNIWKEMSLNESLSEQERSKFSVWDYPISDKYTKIWSQIQEVAMPESIEGALERVRASTLDDGFALLADANLIKYAVMTDCSLKAVGEEFSRKPIALALAKGQAQLRDDISYAILQLINKRFMEVLREKWWTNNPARLLCHSNDDSEGISIENIGGVFIIILAGILLAFLVWAIERLAYSTKLEVSRELLEQQQQARAPGPTASRSGAREPRAFDRARR